MSPVDLVEVVPINDKKKKEDISKSIIYLRDRVGVPRDMVTIVISVIVIVILSNINYSTIHIKSYPAARQLRAHLNNILKKI